MYLAHIDRMFIMWASQNILYIHQLHHLSYIYVFIYLFVCNLFKDVSSADWKASDDRING
jgi:hypothetical protein